MSTDAQEVERPGFLARARDSDIWFSFKKSKITIVAAIVTAVMFLGAFLAPLIAPHNPFDLATLSLLDSLIPPAWEEGGSDDAQ